MKVGRAFFWPQQSLFLSQVAYQPLKNHRGNIIKFVKEWKKHRGEALPGGSLPPEVWAWIEEAAHNHDRGKAETFRITKGRDSFEYSFRGHRFRTPEGMSIFAELIEQGHHDYSTPEIIRAAARIRRDGSPDEIKHYDHFPEALYIFSMCDQLEAETAVRAFYGESESRAFLDFVLSGSEKPNKKAFPFEARVTFTLDPFPFGEPITNHIEYWVWENPPSREDALTAPGRGEDRPQELSLYSVEVTICPLA